MDELSLSKSPLASRLLEPMRGANRAIKAEWVSDDDDLKRLKYVQFNIWTPDTTLLQDRNLACRPEIRQMVTTNSEPVQLPERSQRALHQNMRGLLRLRLGSI